jgi:hypothetical protein
MMKPAIAKRLTKKQIDALPLEEWQNLSQWERLESVKRLLARVKAEVGEAEGRRARVATAR